MYIRPTFVMKNARVIANFAHSISTKMFRGYILTLLVVMLASSILAAPAEDVVVNLPGLPSQPTFNQYAGYLDATAGKHFFYWFTEAQNADPVTAPLVFWFNGGPGCSSVNGMLTENGPFYVNSDGATLGYNAYAWNSLFNVVFLESPAGVGFSYADDSSLIATDDEQVAVDNYAALASFFAKFPEYLPNPMFIVGESYGGIYVPTLSYLVVNGSSSNNYNFQGFAVGNGLHERRSNYNTEINFYASHAMFDLHIAENLATYCCKGTVCDYYDNLDPVCIQTLGSAYINANDNGLNPYNIYGYCTRVSQDANYYQPMNPKFHPLPKTFSKELREKIQNLGSDVPCYYAGNIRQWINQDSVRAALHVPANVQQWDACSDEVGEKYNSTIDSVYPHYQYLLGHVRILVYNGDTDSMCNFLGGDYFVNSLNRDVIQQYRPWLYQNQTAGFVKNYDGISFLTILGSGHMVPTDKPGPALQMINDFVFNTPY
ncbi:hypothetical protein CHUAL_008609 [Chamberlinius hualienensis]